MLRHVRIRNVLGKVCSASSVWLTLISASVSAAPIGPDNPSNPAGTDSANGSTETRSDVVPPSAVSTPVEIPKEPEQTEQVLLELVVTETGTVEDPSVVSGHEPFAGAALSSAPKFRFEPARLKGKPVSARIRFLVRFEPQKEVPIEPVQGENGRPPSASEKRTTAAKLAPAKGDKRNAEIEVVVVGIRPAYTTGVITRAEAREMPGTFGDPLRAVESSAGVTPIFSGVPFFFVRGAPPGNVGFFLDGVKVPMLYHAVLGPSVVHPALIDHVDIYKGAATAQFGRYAGAIINAETRKPLTRLGGEANIRVFDAGALAETPFAEGKGHVLVGGRYSYTALIASLITGAKLEYWDYQTRADYATGRNSRASVFAFGAYDRFAATSSGVERGGGTQFHRVDFREDFEVGRTQTRVAVTVGYDKTDSTSGALRDQIIAARTYSRYFINRNLALDYGGDISLDAYALTIDPTTAEAPDIKALFPARTDVVGGAFTQLNWQPVPFASIAPGVRVDGFRVADKTASSVDPRLAATFRPGGRIYTAYTVGLMHQAPNFVPQVPAAQVGTLDGGLQRAWSASSTVGVNLPYDFTAAATGFRVGFYNLLDPIGRDRDLSFDPNSLHHRERGSATGLELELRRAMTRRIGGFVACTLSRTDRSSGNRESLSAFDRPVVIQAALGIDLGRNFRAGTRIAYYSGMPALEISPTRGRYYSGDQRAAPYFRTDVRLEKRWPIAGRGYWAVVAEMLNATMSKEITSRQCSSTTCHDEVSGPIAIPSIGLEMYSY